MSHMILLSVYVSLSQLNLRSVRWHNKLESDAIGSALESFIKWGSGNNTIGEIFIEFLLCARHRTGAEDGVELLI